MDIADDSGLLSLARTPGKDAEGGWIGHDHHVAFIDSYKAEDRGAVESNAGCKRVFKVFGRNRHTLGSSE